MLRGILGLGKVEILIVIGDEVEKRKGIVEGR